MTKNINIKNKTVIVTGGNGFIGSHLIVELLENGYNVINIDILTYASNNHHNSLYTLFQEKYKNQYLFYKQDIADLQVMLAIIDTHKPSIVFNLAAESSVDKSIESATKFLHSNINGVHSILEAIKRQSENTILFQISTDEIYGDLSSSRENVFIETDNYNPSNPYSASKASAELLIKSYARTYDTKFLIVRCSNNYGEWQHTEKFIPKTITKLIKGENIDIYGTGENIRDWLYVKDCVKGIRLTAEFGKLGEAYNIAGKSELSNLTIARKIYDIIKKEYNQSLPNEFEKLINYVNDRLGHDFRYGLSIDKITKEIGWKPTMNLEQGLQKTIKHYYEELNNYK